MCMHTHTRTHARTQAHTHTRTHKHAKTYTFVESGTAVNNHAMCIHHLLVQSLILASSVCARECACVRACACARLHTLPRDANNQKWRKKKCSRRPGRMSYIYYHLLLTWLFCPTCTLNCFIYVRYRSKWAHSSGLIRNKSSLNASLIIIIIFPKAPMLP